MCLTAKTRQQIALEYKVSTKTLNKWLKIYSLDIPRGLITPKDQKLVYYALGVPKNAEKGTDIPIISNK